MFITGSRPIEAARLGKSLEPYHLFWLEDAVTAELQEGFRIIRKHTTTPLAVGEVFNSDLGRAHSDSGTTDRLPAHDGGAQRRADASQEDRRAG